MRAGSAGGLNNLVMEANPETMREVTKQGLFGGALTDSLILASSRKNLAESQAAINLNAAKAMAPKTANGETVETEQVKQAEREVKAAENPAASGGPGKAAKAEAAGGPGLDLMA